MSPRWHEEGEEPDYRFSLANERTFLAWLRTALGLLGAAVALTQLVPAFSGHLLRAGLATVLGWAVALTGSVVVVVLLTHTH